jgi:hypothetical protein
VPTDVLGRPEEGPRVPGSYCFTCTACSGRLKALPRHAGTVAVCGHCEMPLAVPLGGDPLPGSYPLLPDAEVPGHEILLRHCPRCELDLPRDAVACPFCGASL